MSIFKKKPTEEQQKLMRHNIQHGTYADTVAKMDDEDNPIEHTGHKRGWLSGVDHENKDGKGKDKKKNSGDIQKAGEIKGRTGLVKKQIVDKTGKRTTRWVNPNQKESEKRQPRLELAVEPQKQKEEFKPEIDYNGDWHTDVHWKDEEGNYKPERLKVHKRIANTIASQAGESQQKPKAILMGGGTASGKSTMLNNFILPNAKEMGDTYGVIDSDDIKNELPEYEKFKKSDMKTAAMRVHNESSEVGKMITNEMIDSKKNIILDGTMKNPEKYIGLIKQLKDSGYEVSLAVADVPLDVAKERAKSRAERTGRTVPDHVIVDSHTNLPKCFDQIKELADNYHVFDTSDGATLIASNDEIIDNVRYNQFLDKQSHSRRDEIMHNLPESLRKKVEKKEEGKGKEITLTEDELNTVLTKGVVGIVSAGRNPNDEHDVKLSDDDINERDNELRKELIQRGYQFVKAKGQYEGEEDSYIVMIPDARREEMVELGEMMNQDSVIYSEGDNNEMIFTTGDNKGKKYRGEGFVKKDKSAKDYYTEIKTPTGQKKRFMLGFDFGKLYKSLLHLVHVVKPPYTTGDIEFINEAEMFEDTQGKTKYKLVINPKQL